MISFTSQGGSFRGRNSMLGGKIETNDNLNPANIYIYKEWWWYYI